MNLTTAIDYIEKQIADPNKGLPEEVFLFATRIVPMVNIDLLIKDEDGRVLLSWRDDEYAGSGWHIPGGIIRVKEKAETRVQKVIEKGVDKLPVKFDLAPIAINEMIQPRPTRGHFISLLYNGFLSKKHLINVCGQKEGERGFLKWHESCPDDLISCHSVYRKYFGEK